MKTYRIQRNESKTDFLTTDFMDIWNVLEKTTDGEDVIITPREMTVSEFNNEIKKNGSTIID